MNSDQLLKFKALTEHRTFTQAAESLYMTQSALSHAITALEEELGCKLFLRGPHKDIELTKDGEDLLEYAKIIDDMFLQINNRFKHNSTINISAVNICAAYILSNYPKDKLQSIRLIPAKEEDMPKLLQNGTLDVAICDTKEITAYTENAEKRVFPFAKNIVCVEQLGLLVPEGHSLYNRKTVTYEELDNMPLSMQSTASSLTQWLSYIKNCTGQAFNIAFSTDSYSFDIIQDYLSFPEIIIMNSIYNPFQRIKAKTRFNFVRLEGFYSKRTIYMWYLKRNEAKVQPVIESLNKTYETTGKSVSALHRKKKCK